MFHESDRGRAELAYGELRSPRIAIWRSLLRLLYVFAALAGCQSQPLDPAVASVAEGELRGSSEGNVRVFRGIPYAAAPVGPLRWQPPAPSAGWRDRRDATGFGPACPQPERRDRRRRIGPTSEDCLYLNIWAPVDAVDAPVMVWFHGGAFRVGAGSLPVYDGTSFAANGVVLVTLNYRLGRLGFFAHPSLEVSGNFGFMDQLAALEWVQRNVRAFGGDPDNVTVFGESAGAVSVLHLLTSPKATDLFHKAVVQSGGGLQTVGHLSEDRGSRRSLMSEGLAWRGQETTAAELRALPVSTVLGDGIGAIGGIGPVIDGEWIVGDPGELLRSGDFHRVPVLVGSNSNEASVLAAFGTDAEAAVAASGVDAGRLRALYPEEDWASRAWGDAAFVTGARLTARAVADAGAPAYLYHFDYVLARRREQTGGAGHGSEIPFVFNTLDRLPGARLLVSEEDLAMARRLHSHWLSFARSGDPAGRVEGYWPAYRPDKDTLLYIGELVEAQGGFRRHQLDFHEARWQAR